jgi:MFS family permease
MKIMETTAKQEFQQHWRGLTGCAVAASIGTIGLYAYTSGAFVSALISEAGYTKAQLSLATLLLSVVVAICAPVAGILMDKFGALRVITFSVIGEALAFALLSFAPAQFPFFAAGVVLLAFLGVGTTPPSFARIVTARFDKARGLALGIMISGLGIMAITAPMWVTGLIAKVGWRGAYATMSGLVILFGGIGIFLIRGDHTTREAQPKFVKTSQSTTLPPALKRPLFWIMLAGFLAPALFSGGYLFHLISLLQERGFTPAGAARVQSLIGVAVLCGRLSSGAALDRFSPPRVAAVAVTISGLGCAFLLVHNPVLEAMGAFSIGLTIGAELDIMAYFVSRYFGLESFGRLYSLAYAGLVTAAGASPVLISALAGWGGGYSSALVVSTIGTITGAIILLKMPDPPRPRKDAGTDELSPAGARS